MAATETITITDANTLTSGDLLITFSDETVVLFHAAFLYSVRTHDGNLPIVDPFER